MDRYFLYHELFARLRAGGSVSGYAHVGSDWFGESAGLALDVPFDIVDVVEVLQASGRIPIEASTCWRNASSATGASRGRPRAPHVPPPFRHWPSPAQHRPPSPPSRQPLAGSPAASRARARGQSCWSTLDLNPWLPLAQRTAPVHGSTELGRTATEAPSVTAADAFFVRGVVGGSHRALLRQGRCFLTDRATVGGGAPIS